MEHLRLDTLRDTHSLGNILVYFGADIRTPKRMNDFACFASGFP